MEDPSVLIFIFIVAGICLFLGAVIGLLLSGLRSSQRKSAGSRDPNLQELAVLWWNKTTSALVVEMNEKLHQANGDLNKSQHEQLVQTAEELHRWLGVPPLPQKAQLQPQGPGAPVVSTSVRPTASTITMAVSPAAVATLSTPPPQPKSKLLNPVEALVKAVISDVPKDVTQPKSIAAQVDEILQKKLEDSPLKDRGIRLMELPERGLVVLVGVEEYEGVEDVPDEEIRMLLKECVKDWEKSAGA